MAIVKHTQADRLLKDAVVLDLGDLKRQAAEIVERANDEAAATLERANAEARRRIDDSTGRGYDDGYRKGLDEGREAGRTQAREEARAEFRARFDLLDEKWIEAVDDWERRRRAMLLRAEEDVLAFAFVLAEKVVHRLVEQDPAVVADQVRAALELLCRPTVVGVRVHPDDRDTIETVLPRLRDALPSCRHVELIDDQAVGRGGCIVKTAGGEIDATLDTQLDRIAATLLPGRQARAAMEGPAEPS